MQIAHFVTMFFSGVNVALLFITLTQYAPFLRKKVPGLGYYIGFLSISLAMSLVNTAAYLVRQGPWLTALVAITFYSSTIINTFFLLLIHRVTGKEEFAHRILRGALFGALILYGILLFGNGLNERMIVSVTKQSDNFLFDVIHGPLSIFNIIYSALLSFAAMWIVFRTGDKSVLRSTKLRWILALVLMMSPFFQLLQIIVPILGQVNFAFSMIWFPLMVMGYMLFGYLRTARPWAIEVMDDGYVVFDLHGICVDSNEQSCDFFQNAIGSRKPALGDFLRLLSIDDVDGFTQKEIELQTGKHTQYYRISSFHLSSGINQYCGIGFIIRKVTEYRQHMNMLSDIASHDPLTGVKNRRYLDENEGKILSGVRKRHAYLSVLMLDIDFFKHVNDNYGHNVGDEVLVEFCKILNQSIREEDLTVRYGGEEFLIVCEGIGPKGAYQLAERIRKAVEATVFAADTHCIRITVSIGICSVIPVQEDDMDKLVGFADESLYRAKANGRNCVIMSNYGGAKL